MLKLPTLQAGRQFYCGQCFGGHLTESTTRPIIVGELSDGVWANRYHQIRAVYDIDGISPTLCAGMGEGGGVVPKILERKESDENN